MNIEKIIAALLPPSKREQVLGDLAERHGNRTSSIAYLQDALTVVPPITWRGFWRMRQTPRVIAGAGVTLDSLRRRTEQVQDELWQRFVLRVVFLVPMWILVFAPIHWSDAPGFLFPPVVHIAVFYGVLVINSWRLAEAWGTCGSGVIAADASVTELVALLRQALLARRSWRGPSIFLWAGLPPLSTLTAPWDAMVCLAWVLNVAIVSYWGLPGLWALVRGEPLFDFRVDNELKALKEYSRSLES